MDKNDNRTGAHVWAAHTTSVGRLLANRERLHRRCSRRPFAAWGCAGTIGMSSLIPYTPSRIVSVADGNAASGVAQPRFNTRTPAVSEHPPGRPHRFGRPPPAPKVSHIYPRDGSIRVAMRIASWLRQEPVEWLMGRVNGRLTVDWGPPAVRLEGESPWLSRGRRHITNLHRRCRAFVKVPLRGGRESRRSVTACVYRGHRLSDSR